MAPFTISDLSTWSTRLHSQRRPLLIHLNADTTWLLQLPLTEDNKSSSQRPKGEKRRRTHFNVLIDPWLKGPQSDVAWWFSTQWHVVQSSVGSIQELNEILRKVEGSRLEESDLSGSEAEHEWFIDLVTISHEFTDHCHRATLEELPPSTPIFATDLAADLIRAWNHFDAVITTPALTPGVSWTKLTVGSLPSWLAIGRVISPGNALYYHSAVLIAFDLREKESPPASSGLLAGQESLSKGDAREAEAVVYSPHGIQPSDLTPLAESNIKPLALLHGLHDVQIKWTKQLNLGALNGIKAVEASGARYWIATHDEVKQGGGFIAPMLWRKIYTLKDAVESIGQEMKKEGRGVEYEYHELGSGDGLVLD